MSEAWLAPLLWSAEDLPRVVDLAIERGHVVRAHPPADVHPPPPDTLDEGVLNAWLQQCAELHGIEALQISANLDQLARCLGSCAPSLVDVNGRGCLLVLGARRRHLRVLAPDLQVQQVAVARLRRIFAERLLAGQGSVIQDLLAETELAPRSSRRVESALEELYLCDHRVTGIWQFRALSSAPLWSQLRQEGVFSLLASVLGLHLLVQLAFVTAWYVLGRSALAGVADMGWLSAWALALVVQIPLLAWVVGLQGRLSLRLGSWVKGQLFAGSLRIDSGRIEGEGIGAYLARIYESEALEGLILQGGMAAALAGLELIVGVGLVAAGAGGVWHLLALAVWLALAVPLYRRNLRERRLWTGVRIDLSAQLVESMLGHRTRAVQQRPGRWHEDEDRELRDYEVASRRLDQSSVLLSALPALWMLLGVAGLCPAFVIGHESSMALAVAVGAQIYVARALIKLDHGFRQLVQAAIAWDRVGDAFRAALVPPRAPSVWRHTSVSRRDVASYAPPGSPERVGDAGRARASDAEGPALLECRNLSFRYGAQRVVLNDVSLRIADGERLLLCGPSGGGKSTLAALIAGLRSPESGTVLCRGLDLPALGDFQWRRSIVSAPQFHENHIFTESLAFNLLMGRRWPATTADLQEAYQMCLQVGLGGLLQKMPQGLFEPVGEMGWQLSHGERSRVFLLRALLQEAPLVVLDETFAALDPANLAASMRVVLDSKRAVLSISHP